MTTRSRRKRPSLILRLYLAGDSPNSVLATGNLRAAIAHLAKEEVTLELIDVLRDPDRALEDGVLVTPTLIRVAPLPEKRVIGTLRNDGVLAALGIGEVEGE